MIHTHDTDTRDEVVFDGGIDRVTHIDARWTTLSRGAHTIGIDSNVVALDEGVFRIIHLDPMSGRESLATEAPKALDDIPLLYCGSTDAVPLGIS